TQPWRSESRESRTSAHIGPRSRSKSRTCVFQGIPKSARRFEGGGTLIARRAGGRCIEQTVVCPVGKIAATYRSPPRSDRPTDTDSHRFCSGDHAPGRASSADEHRFAAVHRETVNFVEVGGQEYVAAG